MKRGDRVTTTDAGRGGAWARLGHRPVGTVLRVRRAAVFVRWDGLHFVDEMDAGEVRRLEEAAR